MKRQIQIIIALVFISFVFSCAAKKHKEKKEEKEKIELESTTNFKVTVAKDVVTDKEVKQKKEDKFEASNIVYTGKKGDSLIVTETNLKTGEKTQKTYKGSGTLAETNIKGALSEVINSNEKTKASENRKEAVATKVDLKTDKSNTEVLVDKETHFSWWWLLLIIYFLILAYRKLVKLNFFKIFLK